MTHSSLLMLLAWILVGLASGYLAEKKGRSFPFWFIMGTLFGIFGIVVLFFLPDLNESLKKGGLEEGGVIEVKVEKLSSKREEGWFYIDVRGEQKGPVRREVLERALKEGELTEENYVWCEGMKNWEPFKEVFF